MVPIVGSPEAGLDFLLVVMLVVSTLTAVLTTAPAYREMTRAPTGGAAKAVLAVAAALILLAGVTGLIANMGFESEAAQPADVRVMMKDFAFDPEELTADDGEVSIFLQNAGRSFHTFTIEELGVDVSVPAGESARVTLHAARGEYRFYCKPHAPDMQGRLLVR